MAGSLDFRIIRVWETRNSEIHRSPNQYGILQNAEKLLYVKTKIYSD